MNQILSKLCMINVFNITMCRDVFIKSMFPVLKSEAQYMELYDSICLSVCLPLPPHPFPHRLDGPVKAVISCVGDPGVATPSVGATLPNA